MARKYQRKLLPDGKPNPKYKTRPSHWKKSSGKSGKSGPSGKTKSMFEKGQFIALDGEGGEVNGKHVYQLLGCSDETSIFRNSGLPSEACFEYLLRLGVKHPKGIFVIFAGSYDANLWLRDIPRSTIEQIIKQEGRGWTYYKDYCIRYVQRKHFTIKRTIDKKSVTVWDVQGFFQQSFIKAIENWLPDYDKLELIKEGKRRRVAFTDEDTDFVKEYNQAELDALVLIMERLRNGLKEMGLAISRWDGAGAVAVAMNKKHDTKAHYASLPYEVEIAARHAYFGGRIEIGKIGRHVGKVYHYDINSAYPAIQRNLPALAGGEWVKSKIDVRELPDDTLVVSHVKWSNITNTAFCPFPYRSAAQRKVLFPEAGENWIWRSELAAALKIRDERYEYWNIDVIESWVFVPAVNDKPFAWIDTDYERRQTILALSNHTGVPNGEEKVIKLGLNSLYGKCAQKVGYNIETGRIPPYHNLAYAGHITAATRAALWSAAMQQPDDTLAMCTDGIYTTKPLVLDCPKKKVLGKWEEQTHDEMIMIQAGVYFYRDGEKWSSFSRGFDKMTTQADMLETIDKVTTAWKQNRDHVYMPCTRFITLKSAMVSNKWWERWCSWHESVTDDGIKGRLLTITPEGTKRELVSNNGHSEAATKMLSTLPTWNYTPDVLSMMHNLPWDIVPGCEIAETEIDLEHGIDSE